jgi:hypothetical protein
MDWGMECRVTIGERVWGVARDRRSEQGRWTTRLREMLVECVRRRECVSTVKREAALCF